MPLDRNDRIRVLLIEDNPGDARLFRLALSEAEEARFTVTQANCLAEAVEAAAPADFDVVVTDLSLPDSYGMATVDQVVKAFPTLPVVVLTGLSDAETGLQAVQAGCQDYLVKGAADALISRTLRYAIERKATETALRESEERFRALVEVSPDAILLATQEGLTFANPAAIALCGGDPLSGIKDSCPCHVLLQGPAADAARAILDGKSNETIRLETRLAESLCKTEVEVTLVPLTHGGSPAVQIILRDITARREVERKQQLTAALFQTTSEPLMITDAQEKLLAVNPAFTAVTGYSAAEVLGKTPRVLSSGRHTKEFYDEMWQSLSQEGHWNGEMWNRRKNGEVYVQRLSVSVIYDEAGQVANYVGVASDITDQKRESEQILHRANYDALTGLPNRLLLSDRLVQALTKMARQKDGLALMFIDLDGFKPINDTYGHLLGDQLLQRVAERLCGSVRESDTVARLGGDEFVILVSDIRSADHACQIADKVLLSLSTPFLLGDVTAHISGSIGIALSPQHGTTPEGLLDAADRAMYQAKRQGKGRWQLHEETLFA
ncbi:diguanylate cyclase domain-containing protein [Telmatospirillum sp. J64-1]|uniref:diguanylate cyclase domain-containing protein n=1 Tax=Telmatospirillum sp. J64-1 TaxID=2502183 RepID=UPI00115DD86C|nr:diguanylate cyclase [Telmatospirillum sp. J64-1]